MRVLQTRQIVRHYRYDNARIGLKISADQHVLYYYTLNTTAALKDLPPCRKNSVRENYRLYLLYYVTPSLYYMLDVHI